MISFKWRDTPQLLVIAVVLLSAGGCSLISLKSPVRPLSARDLNARILTREYSVRFIAAVEGCADDIAAHDVAPMMQANALRWKIGAATQSLRAATQMAPLMGLLDTWALAVQMRDFMDEAGAGGSLFGKHQEAVRRLAERQAYGARLLARRLVSAGEFARYQAFIAAYTREYPLEDLLFDRASIVELWSRSGRADLKLVDSLGTIPEAMADFADRIQLYGDTLPSQALWKTQLALHAAADPGSQFHLAFNQLNDRLDRVAAVADSAPELAHNTVADVRRSALAIVDRIHEASAATIEALRVERLELVADVSSERAAAFREVDEQRRAIAIDAVRIGNQLVTTAGGEVRRALREILALLILLTLVMFGLLFTAGYLVGRARRNPAAGS